MLIIINNLNIERYNIIYTNKHSVKVIMLIQSDHSILYIYINLEEWI